MNSYERVFEAVKNLTRVYGKAETLPVSMRAYLSETQTRRMLRQLEQDGKITRIGERGGWKVE